MPELPEVETIKRDLKNAVLNNKIIAVQINKKASIKETSRKKFISELTGSRFTKIERVGKLLIFFLHENKYLLIHLKMTGQLIYVKKQDEQVVAGGHPEPESLKSLKNKHTRVEFEFSDRSRLYFNDMRRFGYMQLASQKQLDKILSQYGLRPFSRQFTLENFIDALKTSRTIKAALMNQKIIAGIGNIYADEACFEAGVRPDKKANELSESEFINLHRSIIKVLKKAIEKKGTSFSNYLNADGRPGYNADFLRVYGRAGKKCRCCGVEIKKKKVAGRGTHYCPDCQK